MTLVFLDLCSLKTNISHKTNIKDPMGNAVISNHLEELNLPSLKRTYPLKNDGWKTSFSL